MTPKRLARARRLLTTACYLSLLVLLLDRVLPRPILSSRYGFGILELWFGAINLFWAGASVWSGAVLGRQGARIVYRSEAPRGFWVRVSVGGCLGVVFSGLGLFHLVHPV